MHFTGVSERVDIDQVEEAKARLLALYEDEQPRYPISSMASDGPEYHAMTESKAGEFQTRERPRYE